MTPMGRVLRLLHFLSAGLMLSNVALGYGAMMAAVPAGQHIAWGFFSALVVAFAHAMTIFYFVGMGVSMREAAGNRRWCAPYLETAARQRRQLAAPLGLAIVTLMAAVILGGGSHTRWLPLWPHHGLSLAALAMNLLASWRAIRCIRANEALIRELQDALTSRSGHGGQGVRAMDGTAGRG